MRFGPESYVRSVEASAKQFGMVDASFAAKALKAVRDGSVDPQEDYSTEENALRAKYGQWLTAREALKELNQVKGGK